MRRFAWLVLAAAFGLAGCKSDFQRIPCESPDRPQPGMCRVPVYETVMVPVYEKVSTPVYKCRQVPVWDYEDEPIYVNRYEPVEGYKTRPVMVRRKKPVKIGFQGRCGREERTLYCVEGCIQTGVERVPATIGHRTVREQWGVKRVPVLQGYKNVQQPNGCKTECVQVGERPERRFVGWKYVTPEEAAAYGQ